MLLRYLQARLGQTMNERVFVNFLEMTMPVIDVNIVGNLANLVAQSFDVFHGIPFFAFSAFFAVKHPLRSPGSADVSHRARRRYCPAPAGKFGARFRLSRWQRAA